MKPLSPTQYPALTKYAEDLTLQIAEGHLSPSINDKDNFNVQRVLQVLHRRNKNDPILIGADSARKMAIVHEVARCIEKRELPDGLTTTIQQVLVFRHDMFFADEENFDVLRDRMTALVSDLKASHGKIALFVDDLHQVIGTLSEKTLYVGRLFVTAHVRGEIQFIGATTPENYRKYIDTDGLRPFDRRSQAILID